METPVATDCDSRTVASNSLVVSAESMGARPGELHGFSSGFCCATSMKQPLLGYAAVAVVLQ